VGAAAPYITLQDPTPPPAPGPAASPCIKRPH